MSVLRSELQADLAELHARGEELSLRYDSAAGLEGLPAGFSADLRRIAAERRGLVDALAALERAHEDLPKAGNPERAWLQALTDRFKHALGDTHDLAGRLRASDQEWLERVQAVRALDWPDAQAAALDSLIRHLQRSLARLEAV